MMVRSRPGRAAASIGEHSDPLVAQALILALWDALRCRLCGRQLKDDDSKAAGVGPECRRRARAETELAHGRT